MHAGIYVAIDVNCIYSTLASYIYALARLEKLDIDSSSFIASLDSLTLGSCLSQPHDKNSHHNDTQLHDLQQRLLKTLLHMADFEIVVKCGHPASQRGWG